MKVYQKYFITIVKGQKTVFLPVDVYDRRKEIIFHYLPQAQFAGRVRGRNGWLPPGHYVKLYINEKKFPYICSSVSAIKEAIEKILKVDMGNIILSCGALETV